MYKYFFLILLNVPVYGQQLFNGSVALAGNTVIYTDSNDHALVQKTAAWLQQDVEAVTGMKFAITHQLPSTAATIIMVGTTERAALIKDLKLLMDSRWEAYLIQTVKNPFKGIGHALVIAGNDRRGAAYGVAEVLQQLGVSPWYWWADVPVKKKPSLSIAPSFKKTDAPLVKYRGIFINDEAPALSGWTKEKFGGFNHRFYEKVFELLIRLKANYIWPAMWGNAFYDDDSLNRQTADDYGIVIGTSHHEPLMRAHDEWRRYGSGKWDYASNTEKLQQFWTEGMQRAGNEKIVSVGMRGDGDEPMSRETAVTLLEKIVADQRQIIEKVTQQPASKTPQLWALYKEVQDYYDKGMRVPDDVTLLLCDDNWGNIRKLPKLNEKPRAGGYGVYYHFDYVGGPRNYKWVNTNPIPRVWEQMHLAWEYNARQIWIVNVGDIKPMEFPISFFLDYAWNPTRIQAHELQQYTERWAAQQFGEPQAKDIAAIIASYTKYNGRRKPELLDANTYSISNYDEANRVTKEWTDLVQKAARIQLPAEYQDAYFQLVLHPVLACANLQQLYTAVARKQAAEAKAFYEKDSLISLRYHTLRGGKWNHMMSQTHIGYTYWQQPPVQKMPELKYTRNDSGSVSNPNKPFVAIEAHHFKKAINTNGITWTILPDHGRTGSAITPFPVTAGVQTPGPRSPQVTYEATLPDTGQVTIHCYFSPTLNFHNTSEGLQYGISVNDGPIQVLSINKDDRPWNSWVANNIIIQSSKHSIHTTGKQVIKFYMVHPGVVLQKLVADMGGMKPSYLGPPETRF